MKAPPEPASRRSLLIGIGGSAFGLLVLGVLLAPKADEILAVLDDVPATTFAVLCLLRLFALACRAEAWALTMRAGVGRLGRRELHIASAPRFLADTVLPNYVGAFVRVAVLRWRLGERAPTAGQMLAADGLGLVLEGVIIVVLVAIATVALGLPWWWEALLFVSTALALVAMWLMRTRLSRFAFVRSFDVLAHSRHLPVLFALLALAVAVQPLRFLLALDAVGFDAGAILALATFVVASAFGALPFGPGPANVGATTAIFGHEGIAAAAAAALLLFGAAIVAAFAYAVLAAVALLAAPRRETPSVPGGASPPR